MKANKKFPEAKAKSVIDLAEKIKKSRTLMIVSIKGLPSKQFQDIKKSLREYATIRVAKKNIMLRAIKELKKESAAQLENYVKENNAFAISNLEGYELASILVKKKTPVNAKAGQIAPLDIEVKEGPTDIPPGPAISELGALGIQIAVENGKIAIKRNKVLVKQGQVIAETAASILQKLKIQPFSVGLEPEVIYDCETEKIYTEIRIDSEGARAELIDAATKALGFAQKITYYCKETIGYLLAKANLQGEALGKIGVKTENKEEAKNE